VAKGDITVWCLLGKKAGDNTQVRALADELGFGYEEKHILAQPWELLVHLGPRGSLAGIDRHASSALEPPWPDLVITAGRRNEPVAQWIRDRSGGRTRLVHIGRPWAPLRDWDLIVTTPQYFLPQQDNILHNSLPLHRVAVEEMEAAGAALEPGLEELPRPWIAVLVGGDSGRFVMTPGKGERLGSLALGLAAVSGGSLLVTDSPRTPADAGDALQGQLAGPHFCYRWSSGGENPYRGLLALADAFVVTGESMSMLGEAADTGKPLYIFDMGDGDAHWWMLPHNYRYKPLSHHVAMALGPRRMRRDVGRIQDGLVDSGRARWLTPDQVAELGEGLRDSLDAALSKPAEGGVAEEELARTAEAVRRLVIPR
jgi:mitochondrial fission protein ELM1